MKQASIQNETCDQINISTSGTERTFYGIPESVMNARVVNDTTSDCIIEWEQDDSDLSLLNYTVNKSFIVSLIFGFESNIHLLLKLQKYIKYNII